MSKKNVFLDKLAQLCEDYEATFEYTNDDDGIHVALKGEDVFVGFLFQDAPGELRGASDRAVTIFDEWFDKNGYSEEHRSMFETVWDAAITSSR